MSNLAKKQKKYGEVLWGTAEGLCGKTSGKGASSRDRNQVWWTEEVVKAVGENKEVWKRTGEIKDRGTQPDAGLMHLYGQNKKAVRRAVDKVRNYMEENGAQQVGKGWWEEDHLYIGL